MELTENEIDFLNRLGNHIQSNDISNNLLVQIIELAGGFLNLKTISDYAKSEGLSYNGVKNNRNVIEMFNVKFVIDNE